MYYTVIKHDRYLRTWGKCREHEPRASVFYISGVFSNVRSGLSQCNTQFRLLHLPYDIEVMWRKTVKHAFCMFYTLIKDGFLTNQSARRVLSILQIYVYIYIYIHIHYELKETFVLFLQIAESYNWSLPEGYRRKGTLCVYGDSVGRNLGRVMQSREVCKSLYERCIISYHWIYPVIKGREHENDDLDFRPEIVIENIHKVLNSSEMQTEGSLMVLNNGLHYPLSVNFTAYQGLIRNLIRSLKRTEENKIDYQAKIIWKTTTAVKQEKHPSNKAPSWRFFTAPVSQIHV